MTKIPGTDRESKSLPFELKADKAGEFKAVFSTFNVIDLDEDVTVPGAFKDGAEVLVGSWGHKTHELPVGKGAIRQDDAAAWVEGSFFLDTDAGEQTYRTLKNTGELQEWSYVFRILKYSFGRFEDRDVRFLEEVDVWSVDPVLRGAGIGTHTTAIKSAGLPFADHLAAIADEVEAFAVRAKVRAAVRESAGRSLSASNREQITGLAESLKSAIALLDALLEEPKDNAAHGALIAERLRFERLRSTLAGVPA